MSASSVAGVGALSVLQAHVAEYEFDGEIADAVAAFAELLAAEDAVIKAEAAYKAEMKGNGVWVPARKPHHSHPASIALGAAHKRKRDAYAACNGGAK